MSHQHARVALLGMSVGVGAALLLWWSLRRSEATKEPPSDEPMVKAPHAKPSIDEPPQHWKERDRRLGDVSAVPHPRREIVVPAQPVCSENIHEWVTIVMSTSPVVSHPSIGLIEETVRSMKHVDHLSACKKLIVCDGYKLRERNKFRSGQIDQERADAYDEYKRRLHTQAADPSSVFHGAELLELKERHGFGYAMREALAHVSTPFLIVVQHDRLFLRGFPLVKVVDVMSRQTDWLHYVGLPTGTTVTHKYHVLSKYHRRIDHLHCDGLEFLPLIQWYDSTHVASTQYYRDFVFHKFAKRVARGGFIEDKLGQQQLKLFLERGMEAHREYGTFLLKSEGDASTYVGHLDGHDPRNAKKFVHVDTSKGGENYQQTGDILEWVKKDQQKATTSIGSSSKDE